MSERVSMCFNLDGEVWCSFAYHVRYLYIVSEVTVMAAILEPVVVS